MTEELPITQTELIVKLRNANLPSSNKTVLLYEKEGMPVAIRKKRTKLYLWSEVYAWFFDKDAE